MTSKIFTRHDNYSENFFIEYRAHFIALKWKIALQNSRRNFLSKCVFEESLPCNTKEICVCKQHSHFSISSPAFMPPFKATALATLHLFSSSSIRSYHSDWIFLPLNSLIRYFNKVSFTPLWYAYRLRHIALVTFLWPLIPIVCVVCNFNGRLQITNTTKSLTWFNFTPHLLALTYRGRPNQTILHKHLRITQRFRNCKQRLNLRFYLCDFRK